MTDVSLEDAGPAPTDAGAEGALCAAPSELELGTAVLGTSVAASVTLTNCGATDLAVHAAHTDASWLEIAVDRGPLLAPGASTLLAVRAFAQVEGAASTTIVVEHDAAHILVPVHIVVEPPENLVRITGFSPTATVGVEVGAELVIEGRGFRAPAYNAAQDMLTNEVTIDGHGVGAAGFVLPRCGPNRLVVLIPEVVDDGALGAEGRDVSVRVANAGGADAADLRVRASSATRPSPTINDAAAEPPGLEGQGGGSVLRSGAPVVVNGAHFAPEAGATTVSILVRDELVEASDVAVDADGARLSFTVPATLPIPAGNPTSAVLTVTVQGASAPARVSCLLLLVP
ncbi:MAG: hypothetical protein KC656_06535 [Myxococcales bacterium]|nr:hypothetical protein [Myxococcales bacterium]